MIFGVLTTHFCGSRWSPHSLFHSAFRCYAAAPWLNIAPPRTLTASGQVGLEKPESKPEELIAAAHAGCFTMALSLILGEASGKSPQHPPPWAIG